MVSRESVRLIDAIVSWRNIEEEHNQPVDTMEFQCNRDDLPIAELQQSKPRVSRRKLRFRLFALHIWQQVAIYSCPMHQRSNHGGAYRICSLPRVHGFSRHTHTYARTNHICIERLRYSEWFLMCESRQTKSDWHGFRYVHQRTVSPSR